MSDLPLIKLCDWRNRRFNDKPFIEYGIQCQVGQLEYFVWHRYSDFDDLHKQLTTLFPNVTLPQLPPKRFLGNNLDPEFIKQRRGNLEVYVKQLGSMPEVLSSAPAMTFFGFAHPAPEQTGWYEWMNVIHSELMIASLSHIFVFRITQRSISSAIHRLALDCERR